VTRPCHPIPMPNKTIGITHPRIRKTLKGWWQPPLATAGPAGRRRVRRSFNRSCRRCRRAPRSNCLGRSNSQVRSQQRRCIQRSFPYSHSRCHKAPSSSCLGRTSSQVSSQQHRLPHLLGTTLDYRLEAVAPVVVAAELSRAGEKVRRRSWTIQPTMRLEIALAVEPSTPVAVITAAAPLLPSAASASHLFAA